MDQAHPESSSMTSRPAARSPRYSDEFKRDAVRLITEEKYKFKTAAQAVGVSEKSLRDWHKRLVPRPEACGEDASIAGLREENRRLRKHLVARAELAAQHALQTWVASHIFRMVDSDSHWEPSLV